MVDQLQSFQISILTQEKSGSHTCRIEVLTKAYKQNPYLAQVSVWLTWYLGQLSPQG